MHILFVLEHFSPYVWWAEVLFDNVVKWLVQKWNSITVLTSRFDKNLPIYEKRTDGVEIYRVGHNRYDFMLYAVGKKGRMLARNADIIHTTTYNAAIAAKILSKIAAKRIVITIHEIFGRSWMQFMWIVGIFYRLFESLILCLSWNKIIVVSDATKNSLIKRWIKPEKIVSIHNWIDYTIWNQEKIDIQVVTNLRQKYDLSASYVWFFFGRPGISKGLEYFIRAIPAILTKIPTFKAFLLVSKDDIKRYTYITKVVEEISVKDSIIWWEKVSYKELINYIAMADFTIIPSLAEGFWFAAVEAATLGKPIISTTAWSLPEVVSWKVAFVKPWDSGDVAEKVYELYQWKYETIPTKTFSWEDNIQKTLNVYHEVLWK